MEDKKSNVAYNRIYNRYLKRIIDVIASGVMLLLVWPLYVVIGVLIVMEDGFPIFYRAERGGYKNTTFKICKFRTMIRNADKIGGGTTALNDSRITKVGNFLRKTKLDETPQLIQVFLGKMSFVGPRPELLKYVNQYEGNEKDILQVRPGITDYSSIKFISLDEIVGGENADEMYEKYVLKQKNELRMEYARTVSFKTDIQIFIITICKVVQKAYRFIQKKTSKGK